MSKAAPRCLVPPHNNPPFPDLYRWQPPLRSINQSFSIELIVLFYTLPFSNQIFDPFASLPSTTTQAYLPEVLSRKHYYTKYAMLNRPQQLHALNLATIRHLTPVLKAPHPSRFFYLLLHLSRSTRCSQDSPSGCCACSSLLTPPPLPPPPRAEVASAQGDDTSDRADLLHARAPLFGNGLCRCATPTNSCVVCVACCVRLCVSCCVVF